MTATLTRPVFDPPAWKVDREPDVHLPEAAFTAGLNAIELALMAAISYGGHLAPTQTELAEVAGISRRTIQRHLHTLREKGWIDFRDSDPGNLASTPYYYWVCA